MLKTPWQAKLIISIISTIIIFISSLNYFDELSFNKEDLFQETQLLKIKLASDIEIIDNKVSGMPDRIQITNFRVSDNEKERIINEIKSSSNFLIKNLSSDSMSMIQETYGTIYNYRYANFYSREFYGDADNIPTRIIVSIYDSSNILKFQKIQN